MASGVTCADEVYDEYMKFKLKHKERYMIMHIDGGKIKIMEQKEKDSNRDQQDEFNEFLGKLPSDTDRYCLVDLDCPQEKTGAMKGQMFLITWCPDTAPPKAHIPYTMSKTALTQKIQEGTIPIQANDFSDLDYDELLKRGGK